MKIFNKQRDTVAIVIALIILIKFINPSIIKKISNINYDSYQSFFEKEFDWPHSLNSCYLPRKECLGQPQFSSFCYLYLACYFSQWLVNPVVFLKLKTLVSLLSLIYQENQQSESFLNSYQVNLAFLKCSKSNF